MTYIQKKVVYFGAFSAIINLLHLSTGTILAFNHFLGLKIHIVRKTYIPIRSI